MADVTRTLARLRVPLGFLFAVLVIVLARPTGSTLVVGGAIALAGEALRIWAAGHLNKSREVTQSGPYGYCAHPLYVGSSVMGVGLALASGSLWVVVLIALYLGSTITAAIRSEEAFLRQKFGEQYDRYRRGDAGARDSAAATRRFSAAQARANHEYRAMIGVVLAVLLLSLKAAYTGAFWQAAGTP
ncbi:MAG: isoprenylcysteine carboxylmethyltransferase family protein [Vicinamibacterales bacterium]